jgi:hypothetical protein
MQPPRPAAVAHGKLSYHACFNFRRQRLKSEIVQPPATHFNPSAPPFTRFAFSALPVSPVATVFLLFDDNEAFQASPEKFRHRTAVLMLP